MSQESKGYGPHFIITLAVLGLSFAAAWTHQIPWVWWVAIAFLSSGWVTPAVMVEAVRYYVRVVHAAALEAPPGAPPPGGSGTTVTATATVTAQRNASPEVPVVVPPRGDDRYTLPRVGFAGLMDAVRGLGPVHGAALVLLVGLCGVASSGCAGTTGASAGSSSSSGANTSAIVRAAIRWACAAAPVVADLVDPQGNVAALPPSSSGGSAVLLVGPRPTAGGGEDPDSAAAVVVVRPADSAPRSIGPHATPAPH